MSHSDAFGREHFEAVFRCSPNPILILGPEGILDCNPAAVAILGATSKEQILGQHPARFSPAFQPDGREAGPASKEMDRLAREKGLHRFEWIHCRFDGSESLLFVVTAADMIAADGSR